MSSSRPSRVFVQSLRGSGCIALLRPLPRIHELQCAHVGGGQMSFLDVAVAADLLRQRSDLDGERVVFVIQRSEKRLDGAEVLLDQLALALALGRVAEHIERGAAETFELREQLERAEHPRAVLALPEMAVGVLAR